MKVFLFLIAHFLGLTHREIEGKTPMGKKVKEGQTWRLKTDLDSELREGIYVVETYYGDRIYLSREDGMRYVPQGVMEIYDIDILDNPNFALTEVTVPVYN